MAQRDAAWEGVSIPSELIRGKGMSNLIADIGMHDGQDTDFYLKKGYDVVAVEANPDLVQTNRQRFADEIKQRRLTLIHGAIGTSKPIVKLYINERKTDWSSIYKQIAGRDNKELRCVEVPGIQASDFFDSYGKDLFYCKIDIEGADANVLFDLMNLPIVKPKYLSIEATSAWHLGIMRAMDYDCFKLINQAYYFDWIPPPLAIHGRQIDYQFRSGSSGLFGEETAGKWLDVDTIIAAFASIQNLHRVLPR